MNIELSNTLTRRKEPFVPADPKRVTMYVCGPTVYNVAHIGNARPPVVFDTLFRLLRHAYGENAVIYARNYTDIDDKIITASIERGVPISDITRAVEAQYEADMGALNVLTPTLRPRATENVPAMIAVIEKLIANGAAYVVPSGVYFSVAADEDYGKLSGRSQDELKAGARVEGEDDKRSSSDFALWKTTKPGEPSWDAPFGAGRPGWHIECSAMIEERLGSPIDIHGGGIDLIFPHHENEIAQSESAHGHPLARVWMHNGFLTMDKTKMSKSIGNIITPKELLEQGWQGETIRWALLSAHYKAPLDWSDDLLKQAQASLDRLYGAVLRLKDVDAALVETPKAVVEAIADDLNTPAAIAALSALATAANIAKKPADMAKAKGELLAAAKLFGVLQDDPEHWFRASFGEEAAEIDRLVAERVAARSAKDYAASDKLRDELAARGVEVMDGASGSTWRRKG
jgi:cysteinyl-tRNA synthetase